MLDLFGILLSSIIMLLVVVRAIQLDSLLPWFKPPKTTADNSGLRLRPDQPAGAQTARRQVTKGG